MEVEELEKKVERMGKMGTQVKHTKKWALGKTYKKVGTQVKLLMSDNWPT